jgi:predicted  nucleic acid-binding Zn-ribbon protein
MTEKVITKLERSKSLVSGEINALDTLITRRNSWLMNNKNAKTFAAVKKDTIEMTYKLQELKDELKELENNQ